MKLKTPEDYIKAYHAFVANYHPAIEETASYNDPSWIQPQEFTHQQYPRGWGQLKSKEFRI